MMDGLCSSSRSSEERNRKVEASVSPTEPQKDGKSWSLTSITTNCWCQTLYGKRTAFRCLNLTKTWDFISFGSFQYGCSGDQDLIKRKKCNNEMTASPQATCLRWCSSLGLLLNVTTKGVKLKVEDWRLFCGGVTATATATW